MAYALPDKPSIAVLPFVNMSDDPKQEFFSDGITEEIITALSKIPQFFVIARNSTFTYKGKAVKIKQVSEELGVQYVLEGSVRRDGDKLRVTVQLIDAKNGYHVWAGTYDRNWSDVIEIQDSISRAIAQKLEVVLTPESERRLNRGDTVNLAAYETYLAATSLLHKSNDLSQLNRAAELFKEALRLDPAFSRAYAGLCEVGTRRYERTQDARDIADAENACRKALELDPSRDETEMALAALYLTGGRNEQAEAIYRGLLGRRPQDADVHIGLALALEAQARREDAEREYVAAVAAEPGYAGAHKSLGNFLFRSGRADEAIAAYRRNVELAPGSASAYSNLGAALMLANRFEEATPVFERSIAIEPSRAAHANLGTLYYYEGRFPDAVREYEKARALAASDHAMAGAMGDALWLISGRRPEAVEAYRRAIGLAQEALKVNPSDAATWAQLAYFSGRAGLAQESARAEARALAIGAEDMYVYYFLALAAADRGDKAGCVAAIEQAQKLGYPRKLLEADPILKPHLPRKRA